MREKTGDLKTAYEMDYRDVDKVRGHYDDWALKYDQETRKHGYVGPAEAARILCSHLATKDAEVLDVGCGTGLVGLALAGLGLTRLDGTDLSAKMIAQCKATGVYRELQCGDLFQGLNFGTNRYDAVISVGTFGPLGPEAFELALAPVKAGGLACISVNEIFLGDHDFEAAFDVLCASGSWSVVDRQIVPHLIAGNHKAHVTVLRRVD